MKETDAIAKALADTGLSVNIDQEGNLKLEPQYIKIQTIKVKMVREGMYKTDPRLVPPELKDENIFWRDLPIEATAITEDGDEIPVLLTNMAQQFVLEREVIDPAESL